MSGIIYKPDGRTPAPGIILYVYHTNAAGYYADWAGNAPRVTDQTPCAVRHGHLRSWMKTDQQGRYAFQTIRPGPYPGRQTAAHIHAIVKEPDLNEYYIADYLFSDDPLLTQPQRRQAQALGGSGLVTLSRGRNGYWEGKRDIVLGANVPDYPAH